MLDPRNKSVNVVCLASYFKGNDFIRECKQAGAHVVLITRNRMLGEDWARECLDAIFTVSDNAEIEDYIHAAGEVARQQKPDIIVALEEADVITAARVGGAHTAEAIEAARGINLWREWPRIECARSGTPYKLPPTRQDYSGSAISLAGQGHPDTTAYDDPEIVFRVNRPYHVGLVVRSPKLNRVTSLLSGYERRFMRDFMATAPQQERVE